MEDKFDLRTKTYILFLIYSIFQGINLFQSFLSYHPVQSNLIILSIIAIIILLIPLILLIINTKKSKMFGWSISLIMFLVIFLYQLYMKINDYSANQLINSYSLNENITILASFVLIIYAISELKNFENKLFDRWISYTFIFVGMILPSLIGILYIIPQIYSQYRILDIIQYLSIPVVYLILLWIWTKVEKNKSIGKFDLRTKIFILLFLIPSTFSIPELIFLWRAYPHFVISAIFYLISLIILLCYKKEKRKIAWMIGIIPSLITLFNPLQSHFNPGVCQGTILCMFQSIKYGDTITPLLMLIGSVIPILIIIFAVTEIINYKKNNFDKKIGIFFVVFYFIRPLLEKLIKISIGEGFSIKAEFISLLIPLITNITPILFIAALLFWIYLDKKKEK